MRKIDLINVTRPDELIAGFLSNIDPIAHLPQTFSKLGKDTKSF